MQLTASEDIEAPLERVFAELSDFEAIERQALRRGVAVKRTGDSGGSPAAGMGWTTGFAFRGKTREAQITLSDYTAPEQMVFDTVSGGLEAATRIEVVALSRSRTRINVTTELKPKTLSARLLVQSLKLAKGGIDKRFRKKMAGYAKDLELKLKQGA
ncbi:SRPBCC family protein [Tropicibacter oceani]|uniref:SRPBCC family protein n=1 Tax=Tropicibacter oceani TaxID=3058420 RepID=A0ABY8QLL8_9RHOB|nr:SRPBCC family protein [Tropicibacter oceani]WGW05531.1 SRPBCC family protein [Tropicibacter oceani]